MLLKAVSVPPIQPLPHKSFLQTPQSATPRFSSIGAKYTRKNYPHLFPPYIPLLITSRPNSLIRRSFLLRKVRCVASVETPQRSKEQG